MTSGGRPGSSRLTERASRSGSSPVRRGEPALRHQRQDKADAADPTSRCFCSCRVEKKERARLKTVKFHARTGMIESNRVSVAGQLLPAPHPHTPLQRQRDCLPSCCSAPGEPVPPAIRKEPSTCSVKQAQKQPYNFIDPSELLQRWEVFTTSSSHAQISPARASSEAAHAASLLI